MFQFKNKTIYIISPENWGTLKVSKHHYATELANLGNTIYFFEPPDLGSTVEGELKTTPEGVNVFRYKPIARGKQYIGKKVYSFIQGLQIKQFIKRFGKPDIVWCFDYGRYDDLSIFAAPLTIFHPVDHNSDRTTPDCVSSADYVFSTSFKILNYMQPKDKNGMVVNHGLNNSFEQYALKKKREIGTGVPDSNQCNTVGFWGNLFKESMDRNKIIQLVESFPALQFCFWGPYEVAQNNVGGYYSKNVFAFIEELRSKKNVILKGPASASEILAAVDSVDMLINLEYESSAMWDNGNPHKILEYLSVGKPILTTPIIMYAGSDFFYYNEKNSVAEDMQDLLDKWQYWNSAEQQLRRIDFALNNTYQMQIQKIENFLNQHLKIA